MSTKSDAIALRAVLRANPRIELEFKGRLSEIMRSYGVSISNDLLSELVLALQGELNENITVGNLPTPQLPPVGQNTMVDSLPRPQLPPV